MPDSTVLAPANPTAGPEALQTLLDASAMLLASTSVSAVLSGILDLAAQLIAADAYAVWRTYDAANWRVLASRGLSSSYRTEVHDPNTTAPVFQTVPDVTAEPRLQSHMATYRREGIRSMLVSPLKLQDAMPEGPNAATITFYWRTPRSFSSLDVSYANGLGNLSSAALNISELHEQNLREKSRLAFLAEAGELLASSLDYETTLQRVAQLAVPRIADWCTVHVVEDGVFTRLVTAHADPAMLDFAKQYAERFPEEIRDDRGLGLLLRTGKPEIVPRITEEMLTAAVSDPEQLRLILNLKLSSSILVPLTSQGKVLGAIRLLAAGGGRSFGKDDLQLAEDLARRAAAAIENAQLHQAAVTQQNTLRLALAEAKMGTWTWDLIKQQPHWSDEFKALHGLGPEVSSSAELGEALVHADDREKVLRDLAEVLESNADQLAFEHRSVPPDGRLRWIYSRGRIERNPEGKAVGIVGISMDVTDRRQSEDALRKTEKLAAAGRLAATVAHEINNPLEAIVNLVYIAKTSNGISTEAAELLTTAEGELTRMAQIVRQTLGFYRESVHPQESNIGRTVSEILDLYRSRIDARSIRLEVDLEPGLSAHVVPGEIKQVAANLIANAIDATSAGGSIRISVRREETNVVITIADTGSGILAANLPHLFEPFFTTKSDVGTGLGLWVSKGIVEKHHGTIRIASSTDPASHGTTLTVTLPLA